MKVHRIAALAIVASFLPAILVPAGAVLNETESCTVPGHDLAANQDILFHEAVALQEQEKYQVLSDIFGQDFLWAMDQQMGDLDLVVDVLPEDPLWDETSAWNGDQTDPLRIAEEVTKQTADGRIVKELIEIAEGATPTLNTWLHMHETSKHKDYWTFFAQAQAYTITGDCTQWQGNVSDSVILKDRQAKTDGHTGIIELPLSQATESAPEITDVNVVVRAKVCRYGWFSGHAYGCSDGQDRDNIKVEWLDAL